MWLIDLYHEVDLIAFLIVVIVGLVLFLTVSLLIVINILHFILPPRLDPELFNERWFTDAELAMFSVWPTSLFKTYAYVALIGFPKQMLKTKRFKGLDIELDPQPQLLLKWVAKGCVMAAFSVIFFGLMLGGLVLYTFIQNEFF